MNNKTSLYLFLLPVLSLLISCGNDSNIPEGITNSNDSIALKQTISPSVVAPNYEMVISDIPFPFEILDNLYSKNVPFNKKAMNDIENIENCNLYNSKAMNLGIYGADLAYAVTYEDFQSIGAYVKTIKRLADELNIPYAFDQTMMDKYSKFKDNKDSLTKVVYDSYNQVDKSLKNDERVGMAALVATGSWLEGLYISTKTFIDAPKTKDNASLYKVIYEQKQSLKIVIKLLDEYKRDAYVSEVIEELNGITSEYNNITSDVTMNEKQLITLRTKIEALRNKIVEGVVITF
ncbi:MAG: hypothetical protein IPP64_04345 [Bacteroidetes bacterium]|nr:hypothetical protein [Bacteroidota bacterium]